MTKKEENDGSCKDSLQLDKLKEMFAEVRGYYRARRVFRPTVRINCSKGKCYVQVKDSRDKWNSVGRATPTNLGIAFGLMMEEVNTIKELQIKEVGIKKGIFKNDKDLEKFKKGQEDSTAQAKASLEMFNKRMKKEKKLRKKKKRTMFKAMKPEAKKERTEEKGID